MYESARPQRLLEAYIGDYLRQEIAAEGLVRNLPAFSDFLDAAALSDGDPVNYTNVARDCGVSVPTARTYWRLPSGIEIASEDRGRGIKANRTLPAPGYSLGNEDKGFHSRCGV